MPYQKTIVDLIHGFQKWPYALLVCAQLLGCGPGIAIKTFEKPLVNKAPDCTLNTLYRDDNGLQYLGILVGKMSFYDTSVSLNCGEAVAMKVFKTRACELGADTLIFSDVKQPDLWSSCFRADAEFYRTINPIGKPVPNCHQLTERSINILLTIGQGKIDFNPRDLPPSNVASGALEGFAWGLSGAYMGPAVMIFVPIGIVAGIASTNSASATVKDVVEELIQGLGIQRQLQHELSKSLSETKHLHPTGVESEQNRNKKAIQVSGPQDIQFDGILDVEVTKIRFPDNSQIQIDAEAHLKYPHYGLRTLNTKHVSGYSLGSDFLSASHSKKDIRDRLTTAINAALKDIAINISQHNFENDLDRLSVAKNICRNESSDLKPVQNQ